MTTITSLMLTASNRMDLPMPKPVNENFKNISCNPVQFQKPKKAFQTASMTKYFPDLITKREHIHPAVVAWR